MMRLYITDESRSGYKMELEKNTKNKIKSIATLLVSAVLTAVLLAVFLIYRYGPSGQYVAGNVILSPETISFINTKDHHSSGKGSLSFIFNGIEFSYFDKLRGRIEKMNVAADVYEQFFDSVKSERGLKIIPEQDQKSFSIGFPATLTVMMQAEASSTLKTGSKVFQIIQFIETDYFRVQLHGEKDTGEWAYFYKPHIYQDIIHLFTQPR